MRLRECAFLAWLFTLCSAAVVPLPPVPVNLAAWVDSLPEGEPPEVPYVVGTTVHLPGGERVPIDGEDVAIVGTTARGTMLLVEWLGYVWVEPDGTTSLQPDSPWAGVQDEAVSPNGRWFARGREVVDLTDGSVVAEIPDRATVVTGWTRDGLVYGTRDHEVWVWPPDGDGFEYGFNRWTWFPGRAPVGISSRGGCWSVVRVHSYDDLVSWPRRCRGPKPLTVSPRATWVLTRDLAVRDPFGELRGYLAGGPLLPEGPPVATYWTTSREVLIALPGAVLRCDVRDIECERALDRTAELPLR